jgi:hypothetical protein
MHAPVSPTMPKHVAGMSFSSSRAARSACLEHYSPKHALSHALNHAKIAQPHYKPDAQLKNREYAAKAKPEAVQGGRLSSTRTVTHASLYDFY